MSKLRFYRNSSVLVSFSFLLLYLLTSAHTVQSGDTGELVTNSYFFRVSHPPGYPLWTLLYHFPVRYLNFGNPFQAASSVTIIISILSIFLLVKRFDKKNECLIISVLASSLLFWRYSVLPDVFSLHVFFLIVIFLVFDNPKLLEKNWIIFFASLGVTNHHTILFVLPLFLYAFFHNPSKKKLYISILSGAISLSIYFFLFLFHPSEYGSWSNVVNFKNLLGHFLRQDYGIISLVSQPAEKSSWIHFFFTRFILDAWSLIIVLFFLFIKSRDTFSTNWKKITVIIFSLIFYFIVFSQYGAVDLKEDGEAVFEKFLIHPIVCVFFLIIFLTSSSNKEFPKWISILLLSNVGINIINNFPANNYRRNTYIEDYLLNILNTLPENVVYFTTGDTAGFGTYYLKDVLKLRPDIIHIHSTWGNDWFLKKFRSKYPNLFFTDKPTFDQNFAFETRRLFINLSPGYLKPGYAKSSYGLIFEISKFKDPNKVSLLKCDLKYRWRNRASLKDFQNFEIGLVYDLKYGDCYQAEAGFHLLSKNFESAKASLQNALQRSPFNTTYQENLCKVYKLIRDPQFEECRNKLIEMYAIINPKYLEFI
jgi:hypothetical protein